MRTQTPHTRAAHVPHPPCFGNLFVPGPPSVFPFRASSLWHSIFPSFSIVFCVVCTSVVSFVYRCCLTRTLRVSFFVFHVFASVCNWPSCAPLARRSCAHVLCHIPSTHLPSFLFMCMACNGSVWRFGLSLVPGACGLLACILSFFSCWLACLLGLPCFACLCRRCSY